MQSEVCNEVLALQESGYAVIPRFLADSECRKLDQELTRLVGEDLEAGLRNSNDAHMVHNPMFRHEDFYKPLEKPLLSAIVSQFLGDSFILYAYTTSSLPPHGTNWARRIHVDSPRLIPGYATNMNVFIPLTDITSVNGAIELLPGSQWTPEAPTHEHFDNYKVIPNLTAGSMLIFHSRLWHTAGVNTTDRLRNALTLNFCRSYMRQRFDYPRMVPDLQLKTMSPEVRKLLGFDVRVPASLDEYYLPEDQRLYKSNQG
jgi:ectoine hydroxylase-related dioxygenase (phytanoyl-CoA dioxygenase family)